MQEDKRYKGLKTGKWISIPSLVPGLLLTVRSARFLEEMGRPNYFIFKADEVKDANFSLPTNIFLVAEH